MFNNETTTSNESTSKSPFQTTTIHSPKSTSISSSSSSTSTTSNSSASPSLLSTAPSSTLGSHREEEDGDKIIDQRMELDEAEEEAVRELEVEATHAEENENVEMTGPGDDDDDEDQDEAVGPSDKRRESNEVHLERLSVHSRAASFDNPPLASTSTTPASLLPEGGQMGTGKSRRASTLSETSSSGSVTGGHPGLSITTSGSNNSHLNDRDNNVRRQKGGNDPSKPARRKAAKTTAFDDNPVPSSHTTTVSTSSSSQQQYPQQNQPQLHSYPFPPSNVNVTASPPLSPTLPAVEHVEIVSYPSADLLRLLAALLDQIARANDELHQRNQSNASGSNTPGRSTKFSADGSKQGAEGGGEPEDEAKRFEKGRFDAAPLNSPVTPRWRANSNAMEVDTNDVDDRLLRQELPVTPGIDLLREVGEGGGAEGFMPSLGGAHSPMPLARRRGSSFLKIRGDAERNLSSRDALSSTLSAPSPVNAEPTSTASLLSASALALASPSATLCFHARNIPAISIEAYLLRILKYCPTTNEVFLSLLVYFDRMARVGLEAQRVSSASNSSSSSPNQTAMGDGGGIGIGMESGTPRLFAIDSFNVHRLIIAGVTVASKFFSDVFYTNSRYAKVIRITHSFPLIIADLSLCF